MEEYKYEIVYVKGKENKVADCLSRLIPIQSQDQLRISDAIITPEEKTETLPRGIRESLESADGKSETGPSTAEKVDQEQLYADFVKWRLHSTKGKVKTKPNQTPWANYGRQQRKMTYEISNKRLTLIRLIFREPLFTPIEKIIQEMMEFQSILYPHLSFHLPA